MKNFAYWLSVLTFIGSWAACYESTPTQEDIVESIWFPVQPETDAHMQALLIGLLVEQGGCLYIQSPEGGERHVPIWPYGFDYRLQGDSTYLILNRNGNEVARTGVGIRLSGGETRNRPVLELERSGESLAPNCPGPYWIVGDEVSVHEMGEALPAGAATGLQSWLNYYDGYIPDWRLSAFELEEKWTLDSMPIVDHSDLYDLRLRPRAWLIPSPNDRNNLDLYAYETIIENQGTEQERVYAASPDSEVAVENRFTAERRRVLFCGTPCSFEAGYWEDNETIVVAGLYQGEEAQYHPAIWWVHLPSRKVRMYRYPTPLTPPYPESYVSRVVFGQE